MPVGLSHLDGVEERLDLAVGEPVTDARCVDLPVDTDVRDVNPVGPNSWAISIAIQRTANFAVVNPIAPPKLRTAEVAPVKYATECHPA